MTEKKETALSIIDNVNVQQVSATMQKISQFQAVVQGTLKQNHDYGIIPGTGSKPTLLKPGAEKILMLMGLTSEYEILENVQDYDKGFFAYTVRCHLTKNGMTITQGLGHCNSRERKYTSDRQDIYMLGNTCLKMAKKRAQVDAALTIAALSEVFTQDLEDMDITGQRTESSYVPDVDSPANVVLTFGKHRGEKLGDIPTGYVRWLADNARDDWLREAAEKVAANHEAGKNGEEVATDEQVAEIGFLLAEMDATEEEINALKEKCGIKSWDELTAENATKLKVALESRLVKAG